MISRILTHSETSGYQFRREYFKYFLDTVGSDLRNQAYASVT
jgi:hypothetical protein